MNQQIQELLQTELHNLQKGLTDLKPAVEHIRIASNTTKLVVAIAEKSNNAVASLQLAQTEYYEKLKKAVELFLVELQTNHSETIEKALLTFRISFEENLAKFQSVVSMTAANFEKHVNIKIENLQSSISTELQVVRQATDKILEYFLKQISEKKIIFESLISNLNKSFEDSLSNLSIIVSSIESLIKRHSEITQKHIEEYSELVKASNKLIEKIEKIDFPSRLDKIDNTISVINLGVSQLNLKLEPLERNIREYQDLKHGELLSNQKRKHTQQVIINVISGTILLVLLILIYMKK